MSRARGKRHEAKIWKQLEDDEWILNRWSNNVDIEKRKIVKAGHTFNPFTKAMTVGHGFPDFIAIKPKERLIRLIECKINGKLDKKEQEKVIIIFELTGLLTEVL